MHLAADVCLIRNAGILIAQTTSDFVSHMCGEREQQRHDPTVS